MHLMRKKGQGMFEYVLLLAGILLIVVLAIVLLRGGLFGGAQKDVKITNCQAALSRISACYAADGTWATDTEVTQPAACRDAEGYRDNGADAYDNGIADDTLITCGLEPGK